MSLLGGNWTPGTTTAFIFGVIFWAIIAFLIIHYIDIATGALIVIGLPILAIVLCIRGVTSVAAKQAIRTRDKFDHRT
jgi:hypothetical protein